MPLVAQERPLGVLSVYATGTGRYRAEQAEILSALGAQVAVTLSHARLYEESVRRVEDELPSGEREARRVVRERVRVVRAGDERAGATVRADAAIEEEEAARVGDVRVGRDDRERDERSSEEPLHGMLRFWMTA